MEETNIGTKEADREMSMFTKARGMPKMASEMPRKTSRGCIHSQEMDWLPDCEGWACLSLLLCLVLSGMKPMGDLIKAWAHIGKTLAVLHGIGYQL